jgi:type II secretory pathway component GspD/PulD (secretin)
MDREPKMKIIVFFVLFLCSLTHAQPITINFKDQPLTVFLKTIYSDILKTNYMISPSLANSSNRVNLDMVFKDRDELTQRLPSMLSMLGVTSTLSGSSVLLSAGSGLSPSSPFPSPPSPLPLHHQAPSLPPIVAPSPLFQVQAPTPAPASDPVLHHAFKPSHRSPDYVCGVLYPTHKDDLGSVCKIAGSSLLLNLTQKVFDQLKPVLQVIDQPGQRVEISTALAEVTLTNSKSSGLRVVAKILGGGFEFGTPNVTGSGLTFKAANFSLVLDALSTDSRVLHVVAPSGVVDSGEKLDLAIGDRQPTLAGLLTNATGTAQQSITYQTAGALLAVTPVVFGLDQIRLDIKSEVSTFSPTTTGIQSPTISQRKVSTALTLQSGQVVALGGLRSTKDSDTKHKLFSWSAGAASSTQITDLVLLVHAKIITD